MSLQVLSLEERSLFGRKSARSTFYGLLATRVGASLRALRLGPLHDAEAIGILSGTDADADQREWAERYLCRLTDVSLARFMEDGQSQS